MNQKKIAISGWLEVTEIGIEEFLADYLSIGLKHVLCTDISKDGMLEGTSIDLYRELLEQFPAMGLIASYNFV